MDNLLGLKLFLIRNGKCDACKEKRAVKHCEVCFDTGLQPEVLEAITTLDLAEKCAELDRELPKEGSYFYYAIKKRERLENIYAQFVSPEAHADQETEVFKKLLGALLDQG